MANYKWQVFLIYFLLFFLRLSTAVVEQCQIIDKIVSFDGEFILAGLTSTISSIPSRFQNRGLLFAEVMKFAINEVNVNILQNKTKLAYVIYDTCGEGQLDITTEVITDLLLQHSYRKSDKDSHKINYKPSCICHRNDTGFRFLGTVGPASSSKTIHASHLTSSYEMPVVSHYSTSSELSNNHLYPYFFRTIPADDIFSQVIVDLILMYKWSYVSIIASDNAYGRHGISNLNDLFKRNHICVAITKKFSAPHKIREIRKFIRGWKARSLNNTKLNNVVIIFADEEVTRVILEFAEEQELNGITWILANGLAADQWFSYKSKTVVGLFTITPYGGHYSKFEKYFWNISSSPNNKWVNQFLRLHGKANKQLGDFKNDFLLYMTYAGFIRNAVYAYAIALKNYFNDYKDATHKDSFYKTFNKTLFIKYFSSVKFSGLANETVSFNSVGDINSSIFFIYNLQLSSQNLTFKKVGTWNVNSGLKITDDVMWANGKTDPPNSTCSDVCKPGFYPLINVGKQCCWICLPCRAGSVKASYGDEECTVCPDITTNSNQTRCIVYHSIQTKDNETLIITMYALIFIGATVSLGFLFTLIKFKNTPVVKASNYRLSLMQVTMHLTLFLTLVMYTNEIDIILCVVRVVAVGFQIIIILAIILVKTQQLLNVFNTTVKLTGHEIFVTRTVGMVIIFSTGFANICLISVLLFTEKIELVTVLHKIDQRKEMRCVNERLVKAQIAYVVVLALICAVQAFRSRNLPSRFNEARFIFYAVFVMLIILVLVVPLQMNSRTVFTEYYVMGICVYCSNLAVLCIIYSQKVWIIWQKPELNNARIFKKEIYKTTVKKTNEIIDAANINSVTHQPKQH